MTDKKEIKILLIEDDEDDFILTKDYLDEIKGISIQLDWIANYDDAYLEVMKANHDLYMIDFLLGKHSGMELMQEAIRHGILKPFIILTGQDQKDLDIQFIQSGASDYLEKGRIDAYVLEKSIIYSIERNNYKNDLLKSQLNYKHLFEELKSRNTIINSILNSLPIVIARFTKNFKIDEIFGSGLKRINADPVYWINNNIIDLFPSAVLAANEAFLKGNSTAEEKLDVDGRMVYFQNYYFYDQYSDELITFAVDVSDLKETQMAYNQVNIENVKLTKINELLDNIIYMAAHDLRSPISNMKMISFLIKEEEEMDEKMMLIEKLGESTDRLEQVLNGLIEIIEIQKEEKDVPESISFKDVIKHVLSDFQDRVMATDAEIVVNTKDSPTVIYQKPFLNSILHNLIGNALKYRSDRPPVIKINTSKTPGFVILEIIDNGIGIDLEKNKHALFKPFSRFTEKEEGKGIGLHLVKTIVEKNGGYIEVESEIDEGTTFRLHLAEYTTGL